MRKLAVAVVLGAVAIAGCSSSSKSASTTTTNAGAATTTASTTTSGATPTTSGTSPTTNTAAPATNGSPAVSASFVSTSHGFAVERSGQIDATTDGGRTWHRVGTLGIRGLDETLRFIGPSDGFAFGPNAGAPRLLITHDAGAHWTQLTTPFSDVMDLAIARGMVYAVAQSPGNTPDFGIWSTPVAHLVWKRDPLALPVGAGPIPVEQIVLAGGKGWIVDENRTVIGGARLNANGTWSSWTPPCATFGGTALLAASTASDLVASCNPGPGTQTPGATSTAGFSHDGGTTFGSRAIPGAQGTIGGVLSPTPDVAVVIDGIVLRRTTDGGASWQVVAHGNAGSPTDYGFTTTTQGFAIVGGAMLMTYDAGATWQRMTLP